MSMETVGKWIFLVSIVIAVIAGAVATANQTFMVAAVLAVLGLVVGILNVTEKEATPFLVATIALALLSVSMGLVLSDIPVLKAIIANIATFAGAAGLIVALKTVWSLSSSK